MIFHHFTKQWKWFYGQYTHSGIRVWRETLKNDEFGKRPLFWKNDSSDGKAIFHQKVKKSMNLTFASCVQDRKIDSDLTRYTKFDKNMENNKKIEICPKLVFRRFCYFLYPPPGSRPGVVGDRAAERGHGQSLQQCPGRRPSEKPKQKGELGQKYNKNTANIYIYIHK